MSASICGRRHVLPMTPAGPRRVTFSGDGSAPAAYSPPCVEPAGHKGKHCAEDGTEWEATQ